MSDTTVGPDDPWSAPYVIRYPRTVTLAPEQAEIVNECRAELEALIALHVQRLQAADLKGRIG